MVPGKVASGFSRCLMPVRLGLIGKMPMPLIRRLEAAALLVHRSTVQCIRTTDRCGPSDSRKMKRIFPAAGLAILLIFNAGAVTAASEPSNQKPQDVFDGMRQSFRADKAKSVHARYQWLLSGPDGGEWWIEVNDRKFKMGRGRIPNPNVTFACSDKTWVALSNGTISGAWAALTGRLKVRGDHNLARKLGEIFP
jgi:putative sterol carrier protein